MPISWGGGGRLEGITACKGRGVREDWGPEGLLPARGGGGGRTGALRGCYLQGGGEGCKEGGWKVGYRGLSTKREGVVNMGGRGEVDRPQGEVVWRFNLRECSKVSYSGFQAEGGAARTVKRSERVAHLQTV